MSSQHLTRLGSKVALVVLAIACAAGGARFGRDLEQSAVAKAQTAAEVRGVGYIQEELAPAVKGWSPGEQTKQLHEAIEIGILGAPRVTAVRVWAPDGTLLYSTVEGDTGTVDPTSFTGLVGGGAGAVQDGDDSTLRTFAAAGGYIGEVQQDAAAIASGARLPWKVLEYALLGIALVLFVSSFFVGNAPKTKAAPALEESRGEGRTGKAGDAVEPEERTSRKAAHDLDPEIVKLHQRVQKAEASRRAMEDQLNVLRSQIQSGDAGSTSRITELEGSLQDAHNRVIAAEDRNGLLQTKLAELEAAVAAGSATDRIPALERELQAAKARAVEVEGQFQGLEARAVQAETARTAHAAQLDEAHLKARQADARAQEALDRASAAEQRVAELEDGPAEPATNGHGSDEQLRQLHEQLAAAGAKVVESERAARDAVARATSAEKLLVAAEARAEMAESLGGEADARLRARVQELEQALREAKAQAAVASQLVDGAPEPHVGGDSDDRRVRELELALADARAEAWDAAKAEEASSFGVVETHAVPEDQDAGSDVPQEIDEDSRVRAELERIGQVVEQTHEAGDVNGLRSRLAKSAARKKGRTGDPASRSS